MRRWAGPLGALGLLALYAGGPACGTAALYRLPSTTGNPDRVVGELSLVTDAQVEHLPSRGWDLQVRFDLEWRGQERSRVDLARTVVRVDQSTWEPCRQPDDVDRDALLVVLGPGEKATRTLTCLDIRQPADQVELRVYASGTGAPGGYIELSFHGVP
ncbi:hypothetical protein L6R53_19540 [Myxococcota bacterium]|nr:hypothetical protein [Myxococcota bacterium]